jgi:hypothetical protein
VGSVSGKGGRWSKTCRMVRNLPLKGARAGDWPVAAGGGEAEDGAVAEGVKGPCLADGCRRGAAPDPGYFLALPRKGARPFTKDTASSSERGPCPPLVRFFKLGPSGLRHKNSFNPPASVARLKFPTGQETRRKPSLNRWRKQKGAPPFPEKNIGSPGRKGLCPPEIFNGNKKRTVTQGSPHWKGNRVVAGIATGNRIKE